MTLAAIVYKILINFVLSNDLSRDIPRGFPLHIATSAAAAMAWHGMVQGQHDAIMIS